MLKIANGVAYGLSDSLWTSENSRMHRLSKKIQTVRLGELLSFFFERVELHAKASKAGL